MRADISQFSMKTPGSLSEVLKILHTEAGTWTPFAGGTDLMVLYEAGQLKKRNFLNIRGIPELSGIQVEDQQLVLGALTTYTEIRENAILQKEFPNLCH